MAMIDDPGGDQFYKEVGVVYVSPSSGKKYYTPCVSDSIKPVLGMVFDSIDHAFSFYKRYATSSGFEPRKSTGSSSNGVLRYDMIFVPFTGVDNHNRNITLGAAILGNETAEMYKWLLRSYVKVFGFAPLVIVTDQDAAIRRAVEDVLPTSRHRLCMWHIWDKLTSKVGSTLCNTTDFKKRLARIVWTDAITPAEFEKEWHAILSDFDLTTHSWLIEIYKIREDWIPAYYRGENLSGLMRTTSRSESENSFFSQFFNPESTLFEFIGHFEAAMECQRYQHRKNDHETRYFTPDIWSSFILEKQAAKIFTRAIFLDQQLEIDHAINQCASVSVSVVNDFKMYEVKDFLQPCTTNFKVMFREEDVTISCCCNRFEQYGLLCRHIFYILRLGEIREFPRKYVLTRWTREVVPNNSNSEFISYGVSDSNSVDVEAIIREIRMDNEYNLNRLVANKEEMYRYRDHVKGYKTKADEILIVNPPSSRKEKFKSQIQMDEPFKGKVIVPIKSSTKGSVKFKRMKSDREIAVSQTGKKQRECGHCKGFGHNQRTCVLYLQSIAQKNKANSSGEQSMQD
ncbi:hypothetical protein QVD17_41749 [Tagetes erecta]|uniref:SWIM-type domain-containing protein n=1 Tax=Tagetes erecta TaxID=13708 RepID=A0AAD8JPQ7_TARER|nr:hypothetical protein QVD17_41749 [Tagetes erecta]